MGSTNAHSTAKTESCWTLLWNNLSLYEENMETFCSRIVTGDKIWVHYGDPIAKQESVQWKHKTSPAPVKFCVQLSAGKVIATVFWDCHGILLVEYMAHKSSIIFGAYVNTLKSLRDAFKAKHRILLSRGVMLLHDNAPVHKAKTCSSCYCRMWLSWNEPSTIQSRSGSVWLLPAQTFEKALAGTSIFKWHWRSSRCNVMSAKLSLDQSSLLWWSVCSDLLCHPQHLECADAKQSLNKAAAAGTGCFANGMHGIDWSYSAASCNAQQSLTWEYAGIQQFASNADRSVFRLGFASIVQKLAWHVLHCPEFIRNCRGICVFVYG